MGHVQGAECEECGCEFEVSQGGGFKFHLLRCDACGKSKCMSFDEIGEPHLRYIKGLNTPYCLATAESDRKIQENYPGEPLSREDYHRAVQNLAGKCSCGGPFKFDAEARCPKCGSTKIIKREIKLFYD